MSGLDVFVVPAPWEQRMQLLRDVRHEVFVVEQKVDPQEEFDGLDEHSEHFLAINEAGQGIGCARLRVTQSNSQGEPTDAKVERMAVLAAYRNLGIGARLLDACVERAKELALPSIYLHAQAHAVGFYEEAGFLGTGPRFMEANIEHQKMRLALPLPFTGATTTPATTPTATAKAREHRLQGQEQPAPTALGPCAFDDEAGAFAAALNYLPTARRQLILYSPELDPELFDRPELVDAISAFVRGSAANELRILIHHSRRIVSRGHRLVELARRLDSKIQIRLAPEDAARDERSFLGWDQVGYWLLPNFTDYTGFANDNDAVHARRLQESFEVYWQRAQEDPELRVLGL